MVKLGKFESPLVDRTLHQKKFVQGTRRALFWSSVNFVLAVIMYLELSYGAVLSYFNLAHPFLWYTEFFLVVLFTVNTVIDGLRYIFPTLYQSTLELNPHQRRLLGVRKSEAGFRDYMPRMSPLVGGPGGSPLQLPDYGPAFSPSSFTSGRSNISGMSTPLHLSPGGARFSPHSGSPGSYGGSPSPGRRTPSPTHGGSPLRGYSGQLSSSYLGTSLSGNASLMGPSSYHGSGGSLLDSFNKSYSMSANSSPAASTLSPLFQEPGLDTSGLRSRFPNVSLRSSPLREDDCMTDITTLDTFMREQQEKDQRLQAASPDTSASGGPSFWSYNRSLSDYSPLLRKYQYQVACRSPQQTKSKDDDTDEANVDEIWSVRNIQLNDLETWIENLRKWLGQTIMARMVKEVNEVNKTLARIGSEDLQIGEVSISTLKQVAVTKATHVPTLNPLIPFLEISTNQEYLAKRIKELGSSGCMSAFKWNGGGEHKGKAWGEHLPTDSAIVMHAFCTYMDSRLPPHPKYPDGKTFTSQHFIKTPDKPNMTKKDNLLLFQTKINPPHYKVVIEDHIKSPQKGRNNVFHAMLLFLYHVKTKERGMLGRVNLGMSGINVLWVLES